MNTKIIKKNEIYTKHYIVDAENKTLGKVSVVISQLLLGKNDPRFVRYNATINTIYVKNVQKLKVLKMKEDKLYYRHSMFPGGFKSIDLKTLLKINPRKLFEISVGGMLPKNRLGRKLLKGVRVYNENIPENLVKKAISIEVI